MKSGTLAAQAARLQAIAWARARPQAPTPEESEARPPFRHDDWQALVGRFATDDGVDYHNFARVRRLLEGYLSRVSQTRPELWISAGERLALYLNAYNAIAIHQVLLHYPVGSLRDVPLAFARPYPVGRELHTLNTLLHAKIRAFGDPRVHAAVVPAARSAPRLRAYSPVDLDQELDIQLRALLADPARGLHSTDSEQRLDLSPIFRWFAGDFAAPERMPDLAVSIRGYLRPWIALPYLRPYMPPDLAKQGDAEAVRIKWLPFDWRLNDRE